MAKQKITVEITFEYDPAEHKGMPARNFLYHFLNKFSNIEGKVVGVKYKGGSFDATKKPISDLPLKKVDSVEEKDIPKPPAYHKDRTVIPQELNKQAVARKEKKTLNKTKV